MQRKTVLIFDLDGTLWGSSAEAIAVMRQRFESYRTVFHGVPEATAVADPSPAPKPPQLTLGF